KHHVQMERASDDLLKNRI
ncbi:hypothetical protein L195_g038894, partial [Trifolium pratense]